MMEEAASRRMLNVRVPERQRGAQHQTEAAVKNDLTTGTTEEVQEIIGVIDLK
jgi:hypothetical protein